MSSVYLHLFHGRHSPFEDMRDGWGTNGPAFGPFDAVQSTYCSSVRGLSDKQECWLSLVGDCVYYRGMFYGDWDVRPDCGFPTAKFKEAWASVPACWKKGIERPECDDPTFEVWWEEIPQSRRQVVATMWRTALSLLRNSHVRHNKHATGCYLQAGRSVQSLVRLFEGDEESPLKVKAPRSTFADVLHHIHAVVPAFNYREV